MRLASYYQLEYRFSYVRTVNFQEIDLIIERPNQPTLLIKIKSAREVYEEMFKPLQLQKNEFLGTELLGVSNDPYAKQFGEVKVLDWRQDFTYIFTESGNN